MILYKYLSPLRIDVLEHLRIRYAQPGAFNDPFEVKPYISHISTDEEIEAGIDEILEEEIKKAYEGLTSKVRDVTSYDQIVGLVKQRRELLRGQFGMVINQFTPMIRESMEDKFNELLGILSLSEDPANLLMWSHYAQSHEGFVIGFDCAHSHFNEKRSEKDEFGYARKVEYRQERPNVRFTSLDGVEAFLVKASEWTYEREWRVLRPLQYASYKIEAEDLPICLFSFPADCLIEIIAGARMKSRDRETLRALARNLSSTRNLRFRKAILSEVAFKVELEDIDI